MQALKELGEVNPDRNQEVVRAAFLYAYGVKFSHARFSENVIAAQRRNRQQAGSSNILSTKARTGRHLLHTRTVWLWKSQTELFQKSYVY
jgi:hypothetical protein